MKKPISFVAFCYTVLTFGMENDPQPLTSEEKTTRYKPLKTPGKILEELNLFRKLERPIAIATARTLLTAARFAQEICDKYSSKTEAEAMLKKYIRTKHYSFDPGLHGNYEDYSKYHAQEAEKLLDDCQKCPDYRKQLDSHVKWLISDAVERPYYVGLTPGKKLKTPGEILEEIDFHTSEQPNMVADQLKKVTANAHVTTNHTLLHNAQLAKRICDKFLKDAQLGKGNFKNHISKYQEWGFDPSRSRAFETQNPGSMKIIDPEKLQSGYTEHLEEERNRMVEDCQRCPYYKKQLSKRIKFLTGNIMYAKNSVNSDPLAELQVKTKQDLFEKTQKLEDAFKDQDWSKVLELKKD